MQNYYIICKGKKFPINTLTVLWTQHPQWAAPSKNQKKLKSKRKIKRFVNHWDVCKSSLACLQVMNKRGISCHFLINAEGIIIQTMDLNDRAYHAKGDNTNSIGVEINNPYHLDEQDKNGPRPIISGAEVHGKVLDDFLGFHPVQIEALKKLWEAVHNACGIPYECPLDEDGNNVTTVYDDVKSFKGFVSHFHIPRNDGKKKRDCAGLDLKELLSEIS